MNHRTLFKIGFIVFAFSLFSGLVTVNSPSSFPWKSALAQIDGNETSTGEEPEPPTNGNGEEPEPPTNDTGGGVTPEPLRAQLNLDSTDIPATYRFEANGNGGTPPYTFHWDFGDGQEANVQNTRHTYENPGTYTATLTVTDATGQTASDSVEVPVEPASTVTTEVEEEPGDSNVLDGNSTG